MAADSSASMEWWGMFDSDRISKLELRFPLTTVVIATRFDQHRHDPCQFSSPCLCVSVPPSFPMPSQIQTPDQRVENQYLKRSQPSPNANQCVLVCKSLVCYILRKTSVSSGSTVGFDTEWPLRSGQRGRGLGEILISYAASKQRTLRVAGR